jgi:general stress protein 26
VSELAKTAPAFVEMAHEIVWASVATVDSQGRPRTRILHPYWEWDGTKLTGWVATGPTPVKVAHLERQPNVSVSYWATNQDTCQAECVATWQHDLETRQRVWDFFSSTPEPLGFDPRIIAGWTAPDADAFSVLRLDPWRLRVLPGEMMTGEGDGEVLTWSS